MEFVFELNDFTITEINGVFDCEFEWSAHASLARREGVREVAIDAVARRGSLENLTESEAIVVQYCREMFQNHRLSDSTFEAAKSRFGIKGLTELTATMGYYAMLACALNAFQVDPPPSAPRLP